MADADRDMTFRLDTGGHPLAAWAAFVVGLVSLPLGFVLAIYGGSLLREHNLPLWLVLVFCLGCFFGVPILVYSGVFRSMGGTRETPAGVCASCGYDLTGLGGAGARCPECGEVAGDSDRGG